MENAKKWTSDEVYTMLYLGGTAAVTLFCVIAGVRGARTQKKFFSDISAIRAALERILELGGVEIHAL